MTVTDNIVLLARLPGVGFHFGAGGPDMRVSRLAFLGGNIR